MSDPLTDAANAISAGSPKIRTFAQLAAARIEADEAEQAREAADLERLEARVTKLEGAPAPPPASTRIGNGLLLNAQGQTYPTLSAAQHSVFGGIIVGGGNAQDVMALERTSPSVHGMEYRTIYEVGPSLVWPGGVSIDQARAGGWIAKNAAGGEISLNGGNLCGAPWLDGYRKAWVTNMQAREALTGCKRHFLDNTDGNIWWGTAPVVNGTAMTNQGMADACYGFLAYVKAAMPGSYLIANVGQGYPSRLDWLKRALTICDAACIENYDGSAAANDLVKAIQAAGRDPWVIAKESLATSPQSAGARTLAVAFASVWDGKGGGFGFANGSWAADANWTSVIV